MGLGSGRDAGYLKIQKRGEIGALELENKRDTVIRLCFIIVEDSTTTASDAM